MIYYFGYAKVGNMNPTGFYEFESHKPEHLHIYNKFKVDSMQSLDSITVGGITPTRIFQNDTEEFFDALTPEEYANTLDPAIDHAAKTIQAAQGAKK